MAAAQSGRSPWWREQVSLARVSVWMPVCSARTAAAAARRGETEHLAAVLGPGEGQGAHGGGLPAPAGAIASCILEPEVHISRTNVAWPGSSVGRSRPLQQREVHRGGLGEPIRRGSWRR